MKFLETKIPPPVVGLIVGLLMWLASLAGGGWPAPFGWRLGLSLTFLALGLGISAAGARTLARAKTTMNPLNPGSATALVSGGIYEYTRNPMYLGMLAWLVGWAAWLANIFAVLLVALFVVWMNVFQIGPEERALTSLFGGKYTAYTAKVRRWL